MILGTLGDAHKRGCFPFPCQWGLRYNVWIFFFTLLVLEILEVYYYYWKLLVNLIPCQLLSKSISKSSQKFLTKPWIFRTHQQLFRGINTKLLSINRMFWLPLASIFWPSDLLLFCCGPSNLAVLFWRLLSRCCGFCDDDMWGRVVYAALFDFLGVVPIYSLPFPTFPIPLLLSLHLNPSDSALCVVGDC